MEPELNSAGKKGVEKLFNGIKQLRILIVNGDISGQSDNLINIGAAGLRKLENTTNNYCLKRVFCELANDDVAVGNQISELSPCDARESAKIVCDLLNYKAQQIQNCLGSSCN